MPCQTFQTYCPPPAGACGSFPSDGLQNPSHFAVFSSTTDHGGDLPNQVRSSLGFRLHQLTWSRGGQSKQPDRITRGSAQGCRLHPPVFEIAQQQIVCRSPCTSDRMLPKVHISWKRTLASGSLIIRISFRISCGSFARRGSASLIAFSRKPASECVSAFSMSELSSLPRPSRVQSACSLAQRGRSLFIQPHQLSGGLRRIAVHQQTLGSPSPPNVPAGQMLTSS